MWRTRTTCWRFAAVVSVPALGRVLEFDPPLMANAAYPARYAGVAILLALSHR